MVDCGAAGSAEFLAVFITADHDHELLIPVADVTAGLAKSYDAKGASPHAHWIQLTAEDFLTLQGGGTVNKYSCNDAHEHEFIIKGMVGAMACEDEKIGLNMECYAGDPPYAGCDPPEANCCGDVDGNFCPEPMP